MSAEWDYTIKPSAVPVGVALCRLEEERRHLWADSLHVHIGERTGVQLVAGGASVHARLLELGAETVDHGDGTVHAYWQCEAWTVVGPSMRDGKVVR